MTQRILYLEFTLIAHHLFEVKQKILGSSGKKCKSFRVKEYSIASTKGNVAVCTYKFVRVLYECVELLSN